MLLVSGLFDYDSKLPLSIEESGVETREGIAVHDISFASLAGGRTKAYLVLPRVAPGSAKFAGALFVHWYEPKSPTSNRSQFLDQAVQLGKAGTVSLLIETMWSDPQWFPKRNPDEDPERSIQQVKELRRALDVLLAQSHVDPSRIAYVGHDFGMMFGAVLAGVDRRPTAFALQAGTASFSEWYLLGRKLEAMDRQKAVERLSALDPVRFIGAAAPRPVLLQFGKSDGYVPDDKAKAIYAAAKEPKQILWYDAGHELDRRAVEDRMAWLKKQLRLK
ncbi:MAG: hypothetical protein M3Z36_10005 [Acidobacteriota bacterium]|nr:hypothetical protein [Acidobacteriota bacterium]